MPPATDGTTRPERILDDVFLTPRVLDDAAFRGYAETLRALIRDAEDRGTRLSTTSAGTEKLCLAIREAAKALQDRTAKGLKTAETLRDQTDRAETLIDRLASAISDDRELERLADLVIEKRKSAFETRVTASVEALFRRGDEAIRKAEQAELRVLAAERKLEGAVARAIEFEDRISLITARIHGATAEAEDAVARLTNTLDEAITRAQQEHDRLADLTARSVQQVRQAGMIALDQAERDVDALRRTAAEAISGTQAHADRAVDNALGAIEQLRTLSQSVCTSADEDAAALERRFAPLRESLSRASALLGDEAQPGPLPEAIRRGEWLISRIDEDGSALVEQVSRAAGLRSDLAVDLDAASSRLQAMDAQRTEICESLEREIEALGGDLSPIERAAAGLRLRLDQLEQRAGALASTLDQPASADHAETIAHLRAEAETITASALQRVEEAGMWLVKLIQRAETLEREAGVHEAG